MNLTQYDDAGCINTMGGVIMYTLSYEYHIKDYKEYHRYGRVVIFFSYRIVTVRLQYCPALTSYICILENISLSINTPT